MKFNITIDFPGQDWSQINDVVEYHDRKAVNRGDTDRTALSQVKSHVKWLKKRYAKYGADVKWSTHGTA